MSALQIQATETVLNRNFRSTLERADSGDEEAKAELIRLSVTPVGRLQLLEEAKRDSLRKPSVDSLSNSGPDSELPFVSGVIFEVLAKYLPTDKAVRQSFIKEARYGSYGMQQLALEGLAPYLADSELRAAFISGFSSPYRTIRKLALRLAPQAIGTPEGAAAFLKGVKSGWPRLAEEDFEALNKLAAPNQPYIIYVLSQILTRDSITGDFDVWSENNLRADAARALGRSAGHLPTVRRLLIRLATDPNQSPWIVENALEGLSGQLWDRDVLKVFERFATAKENVPGTFGDPRQRAVSILVSASAHNASVKSILLKVLEIEDENLCDKSAIALQARETEGLGTVSALHRAITHTQGCASAFDAVYHALLNSGESEERIFDFVRLGLKHKNGNVIRAALHATRTSQAMRPTELLPLVSDLIRHHDYTLRREAFRWLQSAFQFGMEAPEKTRKALIAALQAPDEEIGELATDTVVAAIKQEQKAKRRAFAQEVVALRYARQTHIQKRVLTIVARTEPERLTFR